MIHEFVALFHAMAPENNLIHRSIQNRHFKYHCWQCLTFKAAAEGSSGSPKNGFVFSIFKLFVCLVRTSPILNTTGPDTPTNTINTINTIKKGNVTITI